MYLPTAQPWSAEETLGEHMERRGVTRREFLGFCSRIAVMLGLSELAIPQIAEALQDVRRPSVIWLSLQECTGCVESVLRSEEPTIGDLVLDLVSLDYHHNLMASAGAQSEHALEVAMEENHGDYILVVTGSIPTAEGGIYTTIAGRDCETILREASEGAAAIIAVGACAHWGSVQAARPNPTGAVGVDRIIRDRPIVNIAGCPPIADVVTATIVHYLTYGRIPELDGDGRPRFAYGFRIHDKCPRRGHYDAGLFAQTFDDEGARRGYCLYEVGCKGPATFSPCPIMQWNSGTSWPIGAGHPCIGCTERNFWDTMTPFYDRLPGVAGFGVERTADTIGAALAIGATAGVAAHAVATGVHRTRQKRKGELPVLNGSPPPPNSGGPADAADTPEPPGKETDHGQN